MSPQGPPRRRANLEQTEQNRPNARALDLDISEGTQDAQNAQKASPLYGRTWGGNMNQSFISFIANVGSNASFDTQPAGNQHEGVEDGSPLARSHMFYKGGKTTLGRPSTATRGGPSGTNRAMQQPAMLQSMPALPKQTLRKRHKTSLSDAMTTSQILSGPERSHRVLQQKTNSDTSSNTGRQRLPSEEVPEEEVMAPNIPHQDTEPNIVENDVDLADTLVQMFGFLDREEVIAEYPCYLIQSTLLKGYMYIMRKHICFYAYLPTRSHTAIRSGFLSKRGRNNPKYNRYWFVLKGAVLSYYTNPSQVYFPRGTIDLASAVSAQIVQEKRAESNNIQFTLSTAQHDISFKAENTTSAMEWVKHIQGVIFRLRNGGDSIKLVLPVRNILDLENNPVLDAADTFRFRVIDNDETYAVDEYFFTFFGCGPAALEDLCSVIESKPEDSDAGTTHLEPVKEIGTVIDLPGASLIPKSMEQMHPTDSSMVEPISISSTTPAPVLSEEQQQSLVDSMSNLVDYTGSADHNIHDVKSELSTNLGLLPTLQRNSSWFAARPAGDVATIQAPKGRKSSDSSTDSRHRIPSKIQRPPLHASPSFSKFQDVIRAGAYPLQKASDIAGLLRSKSQRVGSLLATGSLGYYEKAYNMWAGKKMHYSERNGSSPGSADDEHYEDEANHGDSFRAHFALPVTEKLQATYYSYLYRVIPVYGKIYIGTSRICFRSLLPGTRTKMILPLKDIENVVQEKGPHFGYAGLVITIRGHEEIFFEFRHADPRDDCARTALEMVDSIRHLQESRILTQKEKLSFNAAKTEHELLQQARRNSHGNSEHVLPVGDTDLGGRDSPILFDDPYASIVDFKPPESLKITCLTIGSRGDVQPFIALCKGLIAEGHRPTIATHTEFGDWIRSHGIDFVPVAGNPAEIMRLCVENDMFTVAFIREAHTKFRGFISELLDTAWEACQGSDLLIESPSAMAGIHIAEALQIPYFRAFTMPWTRTRAYPHAFAVPSQKLGGNYNIMTYVMFDNLFWQAMAGQINRWRRKTLRLPSTNMDRMQADKVPFLYNFSPSVVVPPLDFNHWIRITGYWFLDEGVEYIPDPQLSAFIQCARKDGKKLVYVGFGSIVVDDPAELTRAVVEAVLKADVRCILSKGWSDRLDKEVVSKIEVPLPESIHQIQSAPHDWLFQQVDAAAHHGGAGTTGASIRAGIPTITKPFFGDQYFFGSRIGDLGVGICLPEITAAGLAQALHRATTDIKMIDRARLLGEQIRSENGVETAIQAIYRDLEYAKSLIKRTNPAGTQMEVSEESWTIVGGETDLDNTRRFTGAQGPEFQSSLAQRSQSITSGESGLAENDGASASHSGLSASERSDSEEEAEEADAEGEDSE